MNILLTGATGFVGKNLLPALSQYNDVHILVRPGSNWGELGVEHVVEFSDDISFLAEYLKQNKIEGIVHLASLYIAEHKSEQVKDLVSSNVYLGTALLEACKLADVKWFLNTGTIWQNFNALDFSDTYNPVNLYAASKQSFITMSKYYTETSDIRFCTLKLCDTFGANDTRKKIFALFDHIATTGETLDMSAGEQYLDILNIEDVVSGFCHLVNLLHEGRNQRNEYVLSSGQQIKLKDLAAVYAQNNNVKLNINWGGRPYRQREVMIPYVGNVLEGWKPLNIKHLINQIGGGKFLIYRSSSASSYRRIAA